MKNNEKLKEEILKEYKKLLTKSLQYSMEMTSVLEMGLTIQEYADFRKYIAGEIDSMKITSLIAALLYVQFPENDDTITKLREDMYINKYGRK